MKAKSFADMNCSVAAAIEAVGDRWGFLILRDMQFGLTRYKDFQASSGIPAQTLATRLRQLEASGLISRHRYQDTPPRDEYALTPQGRDLSLALIALREWGDTWRPNPDVGPSVQIVDTVSGTPMRLALVAADTGQPLPDAVPQTVPGPGADDRMRARMRHGAKP